MLLLSEVMNLFSCCKKEVLHSVSTVHANNIPSITQPVWFAFEFLWKNLSDYTQFSILPFIETFVLFWLNSWRSLEVKSLTLQIWDDIEVISIIKCLYKGKWRRAKSNLKCYLLMGGWLRAFNNNFWYIKIKFIVQMHIVENFQVKYHGSTELQIVNLLVLNF